MERLTGLDASFLYLETPTLHMHVVGVLLLEPCEPEGSLDPAAIKQSLCARIAGLPVFRRRLREVPLGLGHPVWEEDPAFQVEDHVARAALPTPGTRVQLAQLVGRIASRPLDRTRPLWEATLVEGIEAGRMALVLKMHHASVDGVSGANLLGQLFDLKPNPTAPAAADERRPDDSALASDLDLVRDAVADLATRPGRLLRLAWETASSGLSLLGSVIDEPKQPGPVFPFTAPRTDFNRSVSSRRVAALTNIALAPLQDARRALGVKLNDAVLTVCTGALRRYLDELEQLPDKPLVASIPVSVRGGAGNGGDDRGAETGSPTNVVSTMFVRLPVQLADPLAQLREIHESAETAKRVHSKMGGETLRRWAHFASPGLFAGASRLYSSWQLAERHRPIHNLVVSNVPGPPLPLYLAGARVAAVWPLGPILEGAALNLSVLSYAGELDVGWIACPRSVPEPEALVKHFDAAFTAFVEAAGRATSRQKKAGSKRSAA